MNAFESRSRTLPHRRLLGGLSLSAIGLAALAGCGDLSDFVKPITPAEISGEWHATDLVITNASDPTISFQPLAAGGAAWFNAAPARICPVSALTHKRCEGWRRPPDRR